MIGLLAMVLTFFQESEGGVLGNTSTSGAFSVKSTNTFIERLTFFCLAAIIVLSMTINYLHLKGKEDSILDRAEKTEIQGGLPTASKSDDVNTPSEPHNTGSKPPLADVNATETPKQLSPDQPSSGLDGQKPSSPTQTPVPSGTAPSSVPVAQ